MIENEHGQIWYAIYKPIVEVKHGMQQMELTKHQLSSHLSYLPYKT